MPFGLMHFDGFVCKRIDQRHVNHGCRPSKYPLSSGTRRVPKPWSFGISCSATFRVLHADGGIFRAMKSLMAAPLAFLVQPRVSRKFAQPDAEAVVHRALLFQNASRSSGGTSIVLRGSAW